ncbi:ABC transporter substrate-binding protein [Mesonia maritima]|uniref:Iron complex transport system substrate-binding protein n=1 Tax=Mesonia maritima TaxID=1793873 RepID=A0ABU1K565_9FLAO|nr:ABC transporter substrate-binding protein [Mesonia maritima]MDR6300755.1 iron complex transport system substrate-binding protein [Mesonia maritima]
MKKLIILFSCLFIFSCNQKNKQEKPVSTTEGKEIAINYAEGFTITDFGDYKIINVSSPWPKAEKKLTYLLAEKNAEIPKDVNYDQKVTIPVEKMVVTSTTHIPSLESLGVENTLVGFPNLDYISSEKTRKLINEGKIQELGENESINTEVLLNVEPDVVIGFSVESGNKTFQTIQKSGIPVIYNGDWTEAAPLGKAEWIKFFGAFYGKEKLAEKIFTEIESEYTSAKKLAENAQKKPSVLSGAMYKDVWYLPNGKSWQAQFIQDANATYLYRETDGNGSLSLAFESVLAKAQQADYWIAPGAFTSYEAMKNASEHYSKFKAFQEKEIYSYAGVTGETGGVLFYELAPNRPDFVLKDLIKIFHPELLENYQFAFFKPLD